MNKFKFSQRSEESLKGVHKDLVKVVRRALQLSAVDFTVIEGIRSKAKQKRLFAQGASKTMHSRHLTGHAVDIVPYPLDWQDKAKFQKISQAMFQAAKELNIPIRWGGDWNQNGKTEDERFYDGPHFELLRAAYP
ncbi:M15 family metallopeptidase [Avibacterium endocarditidis]|uniref:Peptidase M15 n=1 Tax=Avibacterium endocarditidis TaxID=380674 RepID=A0ABX4ZVD0_9PAST|nr:M15 family metallopeptidase [Avibacterium endocarditidis]POY42900.1 peptidase M15 [Avibacterium endocarditidis]